jgi:hypothetical protein
MEGIKEGECSQCISNALKDVEQDVVGGKVREE